MAPRKASLAIAEILDEIAWVAEVTAGKSLADFRADRATRYIVERSIEIISEASRRIPAELTALRPEIDWRGVGDIGNVLRHEYHSTSAKIVWDVVRNDLPPLKIAMEEIRTASKE